MDTIDQFRNTLNKTLILTPKGIIDRFDLFRYTNYSENCTYGHFGDKDVPWEKIDGRLVIVTIL